MWIRALDKPECTQLLASNRSAHLACSNGAQPYVVPIYYAYADNSLYAFSMPGKKIEWMRANPSVSVLVEEKESGRQWKSVLVDGRYEELPERIGHKREREHCWSLLSKHASWWEPGALRPEQRAEWDDRPPVFYRILIEQLSGREAKEERGP
jgi:nitroimidazol reductase NimA-like FMN-containing flavoprotein (pyridoxamine 5'-phosphate oxidase superfamily)